MTWSISARLQPYTFNMLTEGAITSANKNKVTFRYHNPNTDDETLKHLTQIFVEASRVKFENILREVVVKNNTEPAEEEALL